MLLPVHLWISVGQSSRRRPSPVGSAFDRLPILLLSETYITVLLPNMQPEAPSEQGSSAAQEQETTSPATTSKRRRQSDRSPRASPQQSESSNAPSGSGLQSTTLRPSERSPTRRGSSRESDMHRSSTPPEGSSSGTIKYTRTGRVSKATKGQRVHHCDECGKVSCARRCCRCLIYTCRRPFLYSDMLVGLSLLFAPLASLSRLYAPTIMSLPIPFLAYAWSLCWT